MRPAARQTWSVTVARTMRECRVLSEKGSLYDPEGAAPARFVEKVNGHMREKSDALAEIGAAVLIRRRIERPVDEHRPSDHVFFRDEAPVPAVEADITIVAHPKIAIFGNDNVIPLDVRAH